MILSDGEGTKSAAITPDRSTMGLHVLPNQLELRAQHFHRSQELRMALMNRRYMLIEKEPLEGYRVVCGFTGY